MPLYSLLLGLICCLFLSHTEAADSAPASTGSDPGVIHVPAFDLPLSNFLSPETRNVLERVRQEQERMRKLCPWRRGMGAEEIKARRACYEKYHVPGYLARFHARYAVSIEPSKIAGVPIEVFTPKDGVAREHTDKVLINLHGGGFVGGGRWTGQAESIPIAAVGKFKIVSIDYRMAPEYQFPAASEDVEAVYRELLKTYSPQNIGIYGCSAGGELTGQAVAWLQSKGLPMPGAVGMFCAAASYWGEGDSIYVDTAVRGLTARDTGDFRQNPYLKDAAADDPLAFPIRSAQTMAKFPPSLLISSTRDNALSSVVYTHSVLTALGVEAELHVWEGLGHGFFGEPDLPESRQAYDVIARFFDRHLGGKK